MEAASPLKGTLAWSLIAAVAIHLVQIRGRGGPACTPRWCCLGWRRIEGDRGTDGPGKNNVARTVSGNSLIATSDEMGAGGWDWNFFGTLTSMALDGSEKTNGAVMDASDAPMFFSV